MAGVKSQAEEEEVPRPRACREPVRAFGHQRGLGRGMGTMGTQRALGSWLTAG